MFRNWRQIEKEWVVSCSQNQICCWRIWLAPTWKIFLSSVGEQMTVRVVGTKQSNKSSFSIVAVWDNLTDNSSEWQSWGQNEICCWRQWSMPKQLNWYTGSMLASMTTREEPWQKNCLYFIAVNFYSHCDFFIMLSPPLPLTTLLLIDNYCGLRGHSQSA